DGAKESGVSLAFIVQALVGAVIECEKMEVDDHIKAAKIDQVLIEAHAHPSMNGIVLCVTAMSINLPEYSFPSLEISDGMLCIIKNIELEGK
nr:formyl transferase, C-terminal [Tanacetum cinerariifolium]